MSFAIPQPPSASSDSGSSASLTPTANGYSGSRGYSDPSSSAQASGSLFSSEESKFITDSLSSAESFDPFTIGAPGFKVPSLLPPNIVSTHDHLPSQASAASGASGVAAGVVPEAASGLNMRSRSLSGQQSQPLAYSTSSPGQQTGEIYANSRLNSFNLYGHRPAGGTPPGGPNYLSTPPYLGHPQDSYGYAHPAGRHASFSGASNVPLSPSAAAAGYGKNKAWQMEQLSFLEAQASRAQQHQHQHQHQLQQLAFAHPHHPGLHNDAHRRSSTSAVGRPEPYENLLLGTPPHQRSPEQQQQQQHLTQQHTRPPFYAAAEDSHTGLAMLGAQFPSSHNFGSLQQKGSHPHQPPSLPGAAGGIAGGFSAQALAMLNGDAGLGAASSFGAADADGAAGNSTPRGRSSKTPTNAEGGIHKAARAATPWGPTSSASPSGSASASGTKRTSSGAPKTAPTQGSSLHSGPSGAVIRALGDMANLDLNLDGALSMLPSQLHPYFTPARIEKRTQPHLDMLRQQHIDNGLIDPSTGLEIKPEPTEEDLKKEAEEAEKEKKQHTLLTTEEKKANHIASEQKRRANIRKGYELLCDIVPSLKEALEREASSKTQKSRNGDAADDSGSDADSDNDDDDRKKGINSPSKKKKGASVAGKKGESDLGGGGGAGGGGIEIDGEKIDGRAGPRSEAVVLMKSLDHIGALVEQYRGLLGRRNRARIAVAKKFGWNHLANQPVPDVDRLLAIKVQEWWAAHANGEDEEAREMEEEETLRFGSVTEADEEDGADGKEGLGVGLGVGEEGRKKSSPAKGGKKGQARKKKQTAATKDEGDVGMHD